MVEERCNRLNEKNTEKYHNQGQGRRNFESSINEKDYQIEQLEHYLGIVEDCITVLAIVDHFEDKLF